MFDFNVYRLSMTQSSVVSVLTRRLYEVYNFNPAIVVTTDPKLARVYLV